MSQSIVETCSLIITLSNKVIVLTYTIKYYILTVFYLNNMTSIQKYFFFFFQLQYSKKHYVYGGTCFISPVFQWFHVRKQASTFLNGVLVLNIASMEEVLLNVRDIIECCGWIVDIISKLAMVRSS